MYVALAKQFHCENDAIVYVNTTLYIMRDKTIEDLHIKAKPTTKFYNTTNCVLTSSRNVVRYSTVVCQSENQ